MSKARHHHYLSQCYLKGFTQGNAKKSKLTVFDLKSKKLFETIPRNVGGIRDFNQIDVEGYDPNYVESKQAEFEGDVARAFKLLNQKQDFSGEVKNLIIDFIAMLSIRSPEMRDHLSKPFTRIAQQLLEKNVSTKEQWKNQNAQMLESGEMVNPDITYEEMKNVIDDKQYNIQINREHQIHMELVGMDQISKLLHERNWKLVVAENDSSEFITCDNPVSLSWHYPDRIPRHMSPGFGLKDTMVYFPVSKRLSLVGEFESENAISRGNKQLIAMLNGKIIGNCYKRIFAPNKNFNFIAKGHELKRGITLIKNA